MTLTKFEQWVLEQFAVYGAAGSPHEVFGVPETAGARQSLDAAVFALRDGGYLEQLPTAKTADTHGGSRFVLTMAGRKATKAATTTRGANRVASKSGTRRAG